jgi:D-glycero-D-manno-heptose 1,7-bisphosphate phosphatase
LGDAEEINRRLQDEVARRGGRIDAVMMCPHDPEAGCSCRKPLPGLFIEAAQKMSIDLENSFMIGDAATDLIAARDAGIKQLILVQTGRGVEQRIEAETMGLQFKSSSTLWEAIDGILCG